MKAYVTIIAHNLRALTLYTLHLPQSFLGILKNLKIARGASVMKCIFNEIAGM